MNQNQKYENRNKHIDNLISKYINNDSFNIIHFLVLILVNLIIINLLIFLIKKKFSKFKQIINYNYNYITKFSIVYTFIYSCIVLIGFVYLDKTRSSEFWDNWGGPIVQISNTSNEPSKDGTFLLRKWNAHSSLALFGSGVFIILKTYELKTIIPKFIDKYLISYVLGILLVLLGFASYGWWGSKRYILWRADHALIEGVNLYLILIILNSSGIFNINQKKIILVSLFIWFIRIFYMGQANFLYSFIFCIMSILFSIIYSKSIGNIYLLKSGILLAVSSIVFKVADISNKLSSGTGLFHIFISLGIILLWLWSLTLSK